MPQQLLLKPRTPSKDAKPNFLSYPNHQIISVSHHKTLNSEMFNFIRVSLTKKRLTVLVINILVARKDPDGKKHFYHPDHLGSTSIITNESGDIVEETTYEPFGNVFSGGNDRFFYTGKEKDVGTGLQYYGARYYEHLLTA